jgi:catechol 2,3-dioxygenase-like lactoylglutathione lyase family enzyme
MLDHFGFVVTDLDASSRFYEACLAPLGLQIIERHDYGAVIFAKSPDNALPFMWIGTARPSFWTEDNEAAKSPAHLAFKATSKEAVEAFYTAALSSGGTDNGKPGERGPGYYAAYVLDPDGNNIEAGYRF